ncbi:MAG TPA: YoaK family protein [Gammaproteobacteria bacterium]|nr:YoaK family protein [Gammaproteobacteria bacterium]
MTEDLPREKALMAWALAAVAGFIDAVGYLTLRHLFTAHMSGNSARLGVYLGQLDPWRAIPLASAVLLFIFGIGVATTLAEWGSRRGIRSTTALMLGPQALLLIVFMSYGAMATGANGSVPDHTGYGFYTLAALAIISIGFQVCALQRVAGTRTRTAFVSGMLAKFTQETVNWLFWLHDGEHRPPNSYLDNILKGGSRSQSARRVILFGGIWCFYLAGAVGGSYFHSIWRLWALAWPIAGLAAAVVADLVRPVQEA